MVAMPVRDDDVGRALDRRSEFLGNSSLTFTFKDRVAIEKRINKNPALAAFEGEGRMAKPRNFHGDVSSLEHVVQKRFISLGADDQTLFCTAPIHSDATGV